MRNPYEIVHSVHDAFRGLAVKMSRITGKSDTYWRSHGYEPRTSNPLANGNHSEVAGYMAYCELMQASEPGSGRMLSNRVASELDMRFAENELANTSQGDLHSEILEQQCDVNVWLASKNLANASKPELAAFEEECDEAIEAITAAKSKARAQRRRMGITEKVTNINGNKAA